MVILESTNVTKLVCNKLNEGGNIVEMARLEWCNILEKVVTTEEV